MLVLVLVLVLDEVGMRAVFDAAVFGVCADESYARCSRCVDVSHSKTAQSVGALIYLSRRLTHVPVAKRHRASTLLSYYRYYRTRNVVCAHFNAK